MAGARRVKIMGANKNRTGGTPAGDRRGISFFAATWGVFVPFFPPLFALQSVRFFREIFGTE